MSKVRRTVNYRRSAATRQRIVRHAAIWQGTAARFPGFSAKAGK